MEPTDPIRRITSSLAMFFAALAMGVVGVAVAAVVAGPLEEGDAEFADTLRMVVLFLTLAMAIQFGVGYRWLIRRMAFTTEANARAELYRNRAIMLAASAEAAALLAGVNALFTGFTWHAAPAYGLMFIALVLLWPTPARVAGTTSEARGKYE